MVVRFKKTDDLTYDSLHEHVRLGHLELKERYERGLQEFRESDKRYAKENMHEKVVFNLLWFNP